MFAAIVPRHIVEQILSPIQYFKLVDKGTGRWQVTILSDNVSASESEKLIENLHPVIVVERAFGKKFQNAPDRWEHKITLFFKEHP